MIYKHTFALGTPLRLREDTLSALTSLSKLRVHVRIDYQRVFFLVRISECSRKFAYLLQDESNSFLQTCGPFNAAFRRRSEDGFSINMPITMRTMLMCGLIE